ncbi:MAM and LDL-receptor class A domain-containing protein 1-like isoform X2 [Branchiostoma lanceolatum]|uniref:MAM and LDL-receptor class A domain-containing protein 1-like isoform X2 n=1 Tax=Branchiostoma lanceolatum TaxID=7740 RepID=UPI00345284E2
MRYPLRCHSLVSLFLLKAVFIYHPASSDPCTNYQELNQARRSAAAQVGSGGNLLCDNTLSKAWYRFISYVGGEIPTTCVEPYHCGTQVPIWMNGTLPTDSTVVNRTVCPNYGVPGNCCPFPWNIQVKRCVDTQGVFYVYELVPPTSCSQAYCAETRHPAPCNFEAIGTCEWRQLITDDIDWATQTACESKAPNLPPVDSTLGIHGGHFLSVGSDARLQPFDTARIVSPVIVPSVSGSCNMTLHYYLSKQDAGSLNVFTRLYNTGVERTAWYSNETTVNWEKAAVVFMEREAFEVIIQGVVGHGEDAVLAIDDVSFSWDCVREVDGSVRLVDGARFDEGRVEIYYNHRWGTICNIGWTQTSADVVCAQLGYRKSVWTDTRYPAPDATPILLDDVTCDSTNKSKITECRTKPWENWSPLCNHVRDVSVRCVGEWHQCRHSAFVCSNEACLPSSAQCDFSDDCGDGSDESDCGSFPWRCDFQAGLCNWVQRKDDGSDWTRARAGSETWVPPADHNGNTDGFFMYILGASQTNALLELPYYFASSGSNCSLLFYYFMDMNNASLTVHVETKADRKIVWNQNVSQGQAWQRQIVALEENSLFQVSFEGIVHRSSSGSIAIDDVTLTPGCLTGNPVSPPAGLPSGAIIAIAVSITIVVMGVIIASILAIKFKTAKHHRKPSPGVQT